MPQDLCVTAPMLLTTRIADLSCSFPLSPVNIGETNSHPLVTLPSETIFHVSIVACVCPASIVGTPPRVSALANVDADGLRPLRHQDISISIPYVRLWSNVAIVFTIPNYFDWLSPTLKVFRMGATHPSSGRLLRPDF